MSSLLSKLQDIQTNSSNDKKKDVYRRGAMIIGYDHNPYYVEITSTPENSIIDEEFANLVLKVYDTSLSRIHNYLYNEDVKSAIFIDSLNDADQLGISFTPVAKLSSSIMSGSPVIHEVNVNDNYVRQGLGSLCMQLAEEIFAQAGYKGMYASREGSEDAEYYPTSMRNLGKVGKVICQMLHSNREESNKSAYAEFLKNCGFRVGSHPYDYPHRKFKSIPPLNTEKKTGPILSEEVLKDKLPNDLAERFSRAVYPTDVRDIKPRGRFLTENTASMCIPADENGVPRKATTLQVNGVTLPLEFIEEMTMSKYHKHEE